ncbi:19940_t:CDS:2 [Gigaspora rosea]|nr:19940_t:CDS:2 [Gigaspora rosea]
MTIFSIKFMPARAIEDPQNLNCGAQTEIMMILSLICFLLPFFVNNLFDLEEKTQKVSNFMNSLFIDVQKFDLPKGIYKNGDYSLFSVLPPLILDLELFIVVGYYSILPLNMSNISYSYSTKIRLVLKAEDKWD